MTPMTFPRSLLPMLTVQGSQRLGAIVSNTAGVALAALACALLFARSPADWPTDERYAVARFPSLPIAVAAATMDGTMFAAVSTLIGLRDSSEADGVSVVIAAAALLLAVLVLFKCLHVVWDSPLRFVSPTVTTEPLPLSQQCGRVLARCLLMRRGVWVSPSSAASSPALNPCPAADGGGGLDAVEGWSSRSEAAGHTDAGRDDDGSHQRQGAPGRSDELDVPPFLKMHHSVIASTRGGPGLLAVGARLSVPVETTFTIAAAVLEAVGTSRCERQANAAAGLLAVSCLAFGYALVVAAHPAPVKAVLHAVSAAISVVVTLFVVLALRDDGQAAAAWTQRAQTATLVASGIGVSSTVVTVVTWWLRRRRVDSPTQTRRDGQTTPQSSTIHEGSDEMRSTASPLLAAPVRDGFQRVNPLTSSRTQKQPL